MRKNSKCNRKSMHKNQNKSLIFGAKIQIHNFFAVIFFFWIFLSARFTYFEFLRQKSKFCALIGCAITWPQIQNFSKLSVNAFGQKFHLDLSPAPSLLSNDFIFLSHNENEVKLQNPYVEQCSYVIGKVLFHLTILFTRWR